MLRNNSILFLGEGSLGGPARYFLGAATWGGFRAVHIPDGRPLSAALMRRRYDVIVLSDYRHANFRPATERWLVREVQSGVGLLMIGGWASFTGLVGGYAGSAIESVLPVRCLSRDDRVNCASGAVLTSDPLPVFKRLDWKSPPVIGGYHRVNVKRDAKIPLWFQDLRFVRGRRGKTLDCRLGARRPGLVLGAAGRGRTAAFLTDAAPHWAGGLVDWGRGRVRIGLKHGVSVEVGDSYLEFFSQLLRWTSGSL